VKALSAHHGDDREQRAAGHAVRRAPDSGAHSTMMYFVAGQ